MSEKMAGRLECIGRFCLEVPVEFARKGERYKFGHVTIEEVPIPPGEAGMTTAWEAQLGRITALRKAWMPGDDPTGQVLEKRTLGPGFEAVLYHHANMREEGKWGALLVRDGRGLAFEKLVSFALKENALKRISAIGGAWRPRRQNEAWPLLGQSFFYLGKSLVAIPTEEGGGETAYTRFETATPGEVLSVETDSTAEPDKSGLLARLGAATVRAGVGLAEGVTPVRSGKRVAAGLRGEELIVRVDKGRALVFAWTFAGEESPARPLINVSMETSSTAPDERVARWEQLLDSLEIASTEVTPIPR